MVSYAEPTGYGLSTLAYLDALISAGASVTWVPLLPEIDRCEPLARSQFAADSDLAQRLFADPGGKAFGRALTACGTELEPDLTFLHILPELWPLWRHPLKPTIGYTAWEYDRLQLRWTPLLNAVDRVLVPSEHCRRACLASGITTAVEVLPHLPLSRKVARSPDREEGRRRFGIPEGHFAFYSIEEGRPRKAIEDTVEAYLEAFSAHDSVVLVLKTTKTIELGSGGPGAHALTEARIQRILARHRSPARIELIDQILPRREIELLHAAGDCYVTLSRGEGWGLSIFEAARREKPVVATGWGGQLDYLTPETAFLVDFALEPIARTIPPMVWAVADRAQAARLLQRVIEHPQEAAARGRQASEAIARDFAYDRIVERLLAILIETGSAGLKRSQIIGSHPRSSGGR